MKSNQRRELQKSNLATQPPWQRISLLIVLGYEALGCISGGILLIASPDGRLMDMPVSLMRNVFEDFLIPGIILFGLGILNTLAFLYVLRRNHLDWLMAGLALGGLFIWFEVEIIILQELHWLHLMWGLPVLMGWLVLIPLIALRHPTHLMRNTLLACGTISSILYVIINLIVPMQWLEYSSVSLTVSELSAIDAPTRILWVVLVLPYPLLFAAFGWGILSMKEMTASLKATGIIILIYSVFNFYWPPMHQREIIAAGNGTLTDTMHIAWAMITLLLMVLIMISGFKSLGKSFRIFTIVIWVIFVVFGVLTGTESPGIEGGFPTPMIGAWERINIGAFMLWVICLSFVLIKRNSVAMPEVNVGIRQPKLSSI